MENIMTARTAIEAEIFLLENKLAQCKSILSQIESLALSEEIGLALSSNENTEVIPVISSLDEPLKSKIDKEQFKDYPYNKRLVDKLKYLDDKFPRAWKKMNRIEQIAEIDGVEPQRIEFNFSRYMKHLIEMDVYVGVKYNHSNKYLFYIRREWLNEDGKSIKAEFAPTAEELAVVPESKRGNEYITWVTANNINNK
jgi:hypothetical protein